MTALETLTNQILQDAEHCMAQRRTEEAQDHLEILSEVLHGSPLSHALSAHITSLEQRAEKLRVWLREEQKNAAQANLGLCPGGKVE